MVRLSNIAAVNAPYELSAAKAELCVPSFVFDFVPKLLYGPDDGCRHGYLDRRAVTAQDLLLRLAALPLANASDCMGCLNCGGARLMPFHGGTSTCGSALTVCSRPDDNLMLQNAVDMARLAR